MSKALGKIAYEAYCKSVDWKSIRGKMLPQFDAQAPKIQQAWIDAATAVAEEIRNATSPG